MALHGGMRCLKYAVFFLNFIFWLAGMGVLGMAIWLRFDPTANHYIIGGYGNNVNDYYIITYILMGAGGLMTLVGFLGCCGAYQESKCMLGTFFVFLLLIFGAELAGGIWAFVHKDEVEGSVVTTFQKLVKNEYGKRTSKFSAINSAIDFIQQTLMCCGGVNPKDWDNSHWSKQNIKLLGRVPKSCCKNGDLKQQCERNGAAIATRKSILIYVELHCCGGENPYDYIDSYWYRRDKYSRVGRVPTSCCKHGKVKEFCLLGETVGSFHPSIFEEGCGVKVIREVQANLSVIIGVGLGIAALELLGMIFSVWLCCSMHRSEGGGYKA